MSAGNLSISQLGLEELEELDEGGCNGFVGSNDERLEEAAEEGLDVDIIYYLFFVLFVN